MAVDQYQQVIGVLAGQVQVVQHHHRHQVAATRFMANTVEQSDLVAQVQGADWLVEQHHLGFAHQHLGEERHLPLPAAERADAAPGQVSDADLRELFHGPLQQRVVEAQADLPKVAQHHHFEHRQRHLGAAVLRHISKVAAPGFKHASPRRLSTAAVLAMGDGAAGQRQVAGHGAQQSSFAGAVGAQHNVDSARLQRGAQTMQDGAPGAGEGEVVELDHVRPRCGAKISQSRNGTPTMAVTMPMGNSAPGTMDLDNTDAADSMKAPQMADNGSKKR